MPCRSSPLGRPKTSAYWGKGKKGGKGEGGKGEKRRAKPRGRRAGSMSPCTWLPSVGPNRKPCVGEKKKRKGIAHQETTAWAANSCCPAGSNPLPPEAGERNPKKRKGKKGEERKGATTFTSRSAFCIPVFSIGPSVLRCPGKKKKGGGEEGMTRRRRPARSSGLTSGLASNGTGSLARRKVCKKEKRGGKKGES